MREVSYSFTVLMKRKVYLGFHLVNLWARLYNFWFDIKVENEKNGWKFRKKKMSNLFSKIRIKSNGNNFTQTP